MPPLAVKSGRETVLKTGLSDCPGIDIASTCTSGGMRILMPVLIMLTLIVPESARAASADGIQAAGARSVAARPVAALPTPKRPADIHGGPADPHTLCEVAATTAEYVHRVPPRLMLAIAQTETGRPDLVTGRIRPWPWTINAEGEGHFFDSREQAIAAVRSLQARGVQSIDVGCMQVNLAFHPNAFGSLEDAFDPRTNANYAARFLNALYAEGKDWAHAIGAYHSGTQSLGDAYRVLVLARWQNGDLRAPPPTQSAYRDTGNDGAYAAFAPSSRVYGAFAPR